MILKITFIVDLNSREDVRDKAIETKRLSVLLRKRWDRLYKQLLKEEAD